MQIGCAKKASEAAAKQCICIYIKDVRFFQIIYTVEDVRQGVSCFFMKRIYSRLGNHWNIYIL